MRGCRKDDSRVDEKYYYYSCFFWNWFHEEKKKKYPCESRVGVVRVPPIFWRPLWDPDCDSLSLRGSADAVGRLVHSKILNHLAQRYRVKDVASRVCIATPTMHM